MTMLKRTTHLAQFIAINFNFIYKIIALLGDNAKKLPFIIFLFFIASLIDLLGVGLIGPYVAMMLDTDIQVKITSQINSFLNIQLDNLSILKWFSFIILVAFFIKMLAGVFVNYLIIRFSEEQKMYLKFELMKIYQFMPYHKSINRNSADYVYRIQGLTGDYAANVLTRLLKMLSDILVAIILFVFLAYQNIFVLLSLLLLLLIIIGSYDALFKSKLKAYGVEANEAGRDTLRSVNEAMDGLKEIRILGKESLFFNFVKQNARKYSSILIKSRTIGQVPRYLFEFSFIFFVVIISNVYLFSAGNINEFIPLMAMFAAAALRLLPSAASISSNLSGIRTGRNAVDLLFEDYQNKDEGNDKTVVRGDKQIDDFAILQLENVDFAYTSNAHKALNNISLTIKSGDAVGLIGHSGAGKTSLVDLILGLLDPVGGRVKVNGIALAECSKDWHKKIAYIPQDIFLLDATFEMNIVFEKNAENIDREK
ncbi:MAG: ABC transporter ATP-binding protein/permease, partial [Alphaproteobacteria bacterium]|nr:ABC transporter ATP-binding protein/permease [Alphaproteobacteria bacterium]